MPNEDKMAGIDIREQSSRLGSCQCAEAKSKVSGKVEKCGIMKPAMFVGKIGRSTVPWACSNESWTTQWRGQVRKADERLVEEPIALDLAWIAPFRQFPAG
jgi:hypothetical protein